MVATDVSRQVLDSIPNRALTLLRTIGINSAVRAALAQAGYTEADHAEGWGLMHQVSGYTTSKPLPNATDVTIRNAILEIDQTDESLMRRVRAALEHRHPEQASFVFDGLSASQGVEAVIGVARLLSRLDTLAKGRSEATLKADQEAIATLAKRGIDESFRANLAEKVKLAQSSSPATAMTTSDTNAAREADLKALYAWYSDWSETARAVIRRRDHLISLGLARRRRAAKDEDGEPTEEPEAVTPE